MKSDFSWLEQPVIVPLVKDITLNYLTSLQGLSYEVKSQNVPTNCLTGRCLYCWGSQGISFSVEENKQRVCRCLFATSWRLLRFFMGGNPMLRLGRAYFRGKSGRAYNFLLYPWGTNFKKGFWVVYFVTNRYRKKDGTYIHGGICVGQTEDLSTEFHDHHKQACFDKYKAKCICIHGKEDKDSRSQIERDLIDNYNPPCNRE